MCVGISGLLASSFYVWSKKKAEGAHNLISWILRSLADLPSVLYLSVYLCILYIMIQYLEFLVVHTGSNKEKHVYSIFLEMEISSGLLDIYFIP